jgi:hypothetical protein
MACRVTVAIVAHFIDFPPVVEPMKLLVGASHPNFSASGQVGPKPALREIFPAVFCGFEITEYRPFACKYPRIAAIYSRLNIFAHLSPAGALPHFIQG